jgi:hypothetical protein
MQEKEAIRKYLEVAAGDGHTIVKAESIREMGFSDDFVDKFVKDHSSGAGHKATIYDDAGEPIPTCMGVYTLDFAYGIAEDIGADMTVALTKTGRGFQANELAIAIMKKLDEL